MLSFCGNDSFFRLFFGFFSAHKHAHISSCNFIFISVTIFFLVVSILFHLQLNAFRQTAENSSDFCYRPTVEAKAFRAYRIKSVIMNDFMPHRVLFQGANGAVVFAL